MLKKRSKRPNILKVSCCETQRATLIIISSSSSSSPTHPHHHHSLSPFHKRRRGHYPNQPQAPQELEHLQKDVAINHHNIDHFSIIDDDEGSEDAGSGDDDDGGVVDHGNRDCDENHLNNHVYQCS